jgi:hypothetical protein
MRGERMVWKDCGYLSLSKNGESVSVVVKHVRYFAKLEELKDVLEGKKAYTLVFEPPQKEVKA